MKRYGDNAPGTYSIEEQPKKPGYVLVRLFENAVPFTRTDGEREHSSYEYDEYTLELLNYDGLMADLVSNIGYYLNQAKIQEEQNKSPDDKIAEVKQDVDANALVSDIVFVVLAENGSMNDATITKHATAFANWTYPISYKTGAIRKYEGILYRCLQDHISIETWTPYAAPSLWVAIADPAEEYPQWGQPIASTDAYMKGDKVSFDNKHYISILDNNVWEPTVYGWEEVVNEREDTTEN